MNNKDKYGEVFTPDHLIYQMIDDVSGIIIAILIIFLNPVLAKEFLMFYK